MVRVRTARGKGAWAIPCRFAGNRRRTLLGRKQDASAPAQDTEARHDEARIDRLKLEKAAMPVEVYRKQLSALLVELARVQEELDK